MILENCLVVADIISTDGRLIVVQVLGHVRTVPTCPFFVSPRLYGARFCVLTGGMMRTQIGTSELIR